jgi:hypothetical protein
MPFTGIPAATKASTVATSARGDWLHPLFFIVNL